MIKICRKVSFCVGAVVGERRHLGMLPFLECGRKVSSSSCCVYTWCSAAWFERKDATRYLHNRKHEVGWSGAWDSRLSMMSRLNRLGRLVGWVWLVG